jgi:hypothetical protein
MKRSLVAGFVVLANLAAPGVGLAFTPCTLVGNPVSYIELSSTDIEALLGGSMACYPASGPYTNQEFHTGASNASTGNIIDYKKGPTDPIDPSKTIGSYNITTTIGRGSHAIITYTYTGSSPSSFTYTVWGPDPAGPTLYDFCNGLTPLAGGPVRIATGGPAPC